MNKELKTENQVLRTKYNGPILELKMYVNTSNLVGVEAK